MLLCEAVPLRHRVSARRSDQTCLGMAMTRNVRCGVDVRIGVPTRAWTWTSTRREATCLVVHGMVIHSRMMTGWVRSAPGQVLLLLLLVMIMVMLMLRMHRMASVARVGRVGCVDGTGRVSCME